MAATLEAKITYTCPVDGKEKTVPFDQIDIDLDSGCGCYSGCSVDTITVYCDCSKNGYHDLKFR